MNQHPHTDALLRLHGMLHPERYDPKAPLYQWSPDTIEQIAQALERDLRGVPGFRAADDPTITVERVDIAIQAAIENQQAAMTDPNWDDLGSGDEPVQDAFSAGVCEGLAAAWRIAKQLIEDPYGPLQDAPDA